MLPLDRSHKEIGEDILFSIHYNGQHLHFNVVQDYAVSAVSGQDIR
jgi:hypothetical protein